MITDRWQQITSIFHAALALAPPERATYLQQACGGDPSIRSEVESLLSSHAETGSAPLLDPARFNGLIAALADEPRATHEASEPGPGARVGRFRILRRIATGGMGVVHEAEQEAPRRRVALKMVHGILRGDQADERSVYLFRREIQALARLSHPAIASIYDSGITDDGQPYFAMELVDGEPLDRYLRAHRLPLRARLEIFSRICDAIAYAHQRGVIHRDIKPANILVCRDEHDPAGEIRLKILDFGIARLVDTDAEVSRTISAGVIQGTLPYMSPEQARGDPERIDFRTDVYSLGVVLYLLLTETLPHEIRGTSITSAIRFICEERARPPRSVDRGIPEDLEIIVLKALEKEPSTRYQSVADLVRDIRHYLRGEPIEARRASTWYVLRRLMARHKTQTILGATVATSVLAGGILSTSFWQQSRSQLAETTRQRLMANSSAVLAEDPGLALLLAIEAARQKTDRLSNDAMLSALRHLREIRTVLVGGWADDAAFDPSGNLVAAACRDGVVRVYSGEREAPPAELRGHDGQVLAVDFDPTGRTLLSAGEDGTLRLWDLDSQREVLCRRASATPVLCARFAPGGSMIAWADAVGHAAVWSTTGDRLVSLDGHRGAVTSIGFQASGPTILTCSADSTARVWDAATGIQRAAFRSGLPLSSADLTRDGSMIAAASDDHYAEDHNAWVWDAAFGNEKAILRGHADAVSCIAFSPDGKWIATGGADRSVRLWDARTGHEVARLRGHGGLIRCLRFSPDGRRIATGAEDGTLRVWDATLLPQRRLGEGERLESAPSLIREGLRLVRMSGQEAAAVLDAIADEQPCTLAVLRGADALTVHVLSLDRDRTRALTCSDKSRSVLLWDLASGRARLRMDGHREHACSARFSPDGRLVASSSADGTVRTWDAATGRSIAVLDGHADTVENVTFSPDGHLLASASNDATARVWDSATGDLVAVLRGHRNTVHYASFSADSRLLITASSDSTARLWEARTGRALAILRGHVGGLTTARLSPDGRHAITTGWDATVRLWDAISGDEVATLATDVYLFADFVRGGREILLANWDKPSQRWPLDITSFAIERSPRELTAEERRRFDLD